MSPCRQIGCFVNLHNPFWPFQSAAGNSLPADGVGVGGAPEMLNGSLLGQTRGDTQNLWRIVMAQRTGSYAYQGASEGRKIWQNR